MERRQFLYLSGLSTLGARLALSPQTADPFDELARLVEAKMAEHHIPGVAFGVLRNGKRTVRGFGVTSVEDPKPITPDTVFPIASISKTFTATAIMRLVDQGKMDLKSPIRKILPEFKVQDEAVSREVSVWHLLTHSPGWEGQIAATDKGVDTMSAFAARMADWPQVSAPGSVWSYNNAGFNLAGRVIEVVHGKGIHDALKDLVYAPLGLKRATTRTGEAMSYRFAQGHRQRPQGTQTDQSHSFELPPDITAGGIATTVQDLLTYAEFHLGDGTAQGQRVLTQAALDLMKTAQLKKNSTDDEIGLAWQLRHLNGVLTAAHGGTLGGHTLHIQLVPARKLAFVILTNHGDGWRLIQDVERATLKAYEGLTLTPNQAIGHRGVSEAMTGHASPLPNQPALAEYVGIYQRPSGKVEVRNDGGKLIVVNGNAATGSALVFYGPDIAYAAAGPAYVGTPHEFVRTSQGKVGWIRINGRISRKDA